MTLEKETLKVEKGRLGIIIDGRIKHTASISRVNLGEDKGEWRILARTIGGKKYMPFESIENFYHRRYPNSELNFIFNYKNINKI